MGLVSSVDVLHPRDGSWSQCCLVLKWSYLTKNSIVLCPPYEARNMAARML